MPRGGKRIGAGRPEHLTLRQRWSVGAACEHLWRKLGEKEAWRRYEAQPHIQQVREQQARLYFMERGSDSENQRIARRRRVVRSGVLSEVSEEIDDILSGERSQSTKVPQLRRADRVLGVAIVWCRRRYGVQINKRYARLCWDEFRKLERSLISV